MWLWLPFSLKTIGMRWSKFWRQTVKLYFSSITYDWFLHTNLCAYLEKKFFFFQNEFHNFFYEKLGCCPSLLARGSSTICNKKFNLSKEEEEEVKKMFRRIYFHSLSLSSKCKSPCTRSIFTSKMTHRIPDSDSAIFITFHPSIEVFQSRLSVDAQTLLTRLGGSISSGRTLLWLLLSIFGACQVAILVQVWHFHVAIFIIVCHFSGGLFEWYFTGVKNVPTTM